VNCCPLDNCRINLRIATKQIQRINQTQRRGTFQLEVYLNKNRFVTSWVDSLGVKKTANFSINKYGYEIAKQKAIDKRIEMGLTLNHYHLALLNLAPLEPQEPEADYEFEEPEDAAN